MKTIYEMKVHKGNRRLEDILRDSNEFPGLGHAVYISGESIEPVRWKRHEEDMINLSKEHPGFVFSLHGTGRKQGDIWIKYFKNGFMQESEATITFEPYDEDKLREMGASKERRDFAKEVEIDIANLKVF